VVEFVDVDDWLRRGLPEEGLDLAVKSTVLAWTRW
jgi:hypothetical protein